MSAEKKSIGSTLSKKLTRVRQSFSQAIGKSYKTRDEDFECLFKIFTTQQSHIMRYQRELRNYYETLQRLKITNKQLMNAIWDLYDPAWVESDQIQVKTDMMENAFLAYLNSFKSRVLDPVQKYVKRFDEVNAKISKREKKLLDFDASKHQLARRQSSRNRDPLEVVKAEESVEQHRVIYDSINDELMSELPQFYKNRVYFLGHNFQSLFGTGATFHSEYANMFSQLSEGMQELNRTCFKTGLMNSQLSFGGSSTSISKASSECSSLERVEKVPKSRPSDAFEKVDEAAMIMKEEIAREKSGSFKEDDTDGSETSDATSKDGKAPVLEIPQVQEESGSVPNKSNISTDNDPNKEPKKDKTTI